MMGDSRAKEMRKNEILSKLGCIERNAKLLDHEKAWIEQAINYIKEVVNE